MKLGALLGPIVDAAQGEILAEQARTYSGEGYDSLWSVQAIGRGFMITDPFITLAVAASVARDVEIGTAIVQVPLYQPMDLAHRVLSLRQICGDRLLLGVGAGSTEQDFIAFGRDYDARFGAFDEAMVELRQIFSTGGNGVSALSPWPAMAGGLPLFLGTWGAGVERAAHEFDGWIASGANRTVEQLSDTIARYRGAGGGRAIVSTVQLGGDCDLGELQDRLDHYAEAGFDGVVVMILPGGPRAADVRRLVD